MAVQLHRRLLPLADACNAQSRPNSERGRLASTESSAAGSSLPAIYIFSVHVFSVHDEEILQPRPVHPATIVGDYDLFLLAVERHPHDWIRAWVDVLKSVRDVFPNHEFISLEKPCAL